MTVHIARAGLQDADTIATMVGELLHDIMAAVNDKVFVFHHDDMQQFSTFFWCLGPDSSWEPDGSLSLFHYSVRELLNCWKCR